MLTLALKPSVRSVKFTLSDVELTVPTTLFWFVGLVPPPSV